MTDLAQKSNLSDYKSEGSESYTYPFAGIGTRSQFTSGDDVSFVQSNEQTGLHLWCGHFLLQKLKDWDTESLHSFLKKSNLEPKQ